MKGMIRQKQEPQPIRYTRGFSRDELTEALKRYLSSEGCPVPEGEAFVWGLERGRDYCEGEAVTLVIDARE